MLPGEEASDKSRRKQRGVDPVADFHRELACLMCGRVAPPPPPPVPARCPICGGAWIIQDVYEPRYG